jgi:5-methylthioadenosine/S-adenosylhomocysteine deaminase
LALANGQPFVAAHLNYIEDSHIAALADSQCTVAYCPRASTYFGHANHRWQEMLQAGVHVALGTDSLLCIDTVDRISVIDEMRLLYSRDQADPVDLMKMGTVHGAIGLGVDPSLVTIDEGKVAGMLLFETSGGDPLLEIMNSTNMPTWVIEG